MYDTIFLKRHFLEEMQAVHDAFPDEKYVGFMEFTMPVVIIRDPDLIKSIIIKDFDHFTDHREFFTEESDPLFAGSLFLMKGERWRQMRTTLSPAFTGSKMKLMLPLIVENTNNIIQYLRSHQSEIIEVEDLMRRYANDVIASAGFGLKINSLVDRNNEFFEIGSSVFDFTIKQRALLALSTLFPEVNKKLGIHFFPKRTYNFFRNVVATTMEYRKREHVERPDMIQLLMETKGDWTPDEITGQVFIFFAAGFDTIASVLVMTIHELALHPEVQEKLYQECRQLKEDKGLTFDSLSELKYLDCVINETLRKWTPAIFMDRTCVKTYELPPPREGGKPYILKPGDVIYNMVNCLHMDPNYYPDPHKFDPERFSEENKHKIIPYTFSPFGGGPRICIGMRFAMMELKVLISEILLNFMIVKTEKTMDPIKLKPHNFSIKALNGTLCTITVESRRARNMILEISLFLLTTLVGYIIYSYKQMNEFFQRRGVKHFPGLPFFGNMYDTTFLKKHFLDEIQAIHDAFPDEKYVGFMEFTMPVLLIRDPDLIKSIIVKDFDHFTDHREFFTEESDPLFAGSLLLMKGERWREMRTTLSPAFTGSKMKMMLPLIVENTVNIIQYLHDRQSENIEVDDLMRRYTNDVIASAGFGLKINSLVDRDNEFFKIGHTVFDFNLKQRALFILSTIFPKLTKKLGVRLFPEKTYNFFRNVVASTIEYRKREHVERPDMIQLLMETKREWSPDDLTSQVFIFFAAGFDTVASVLVMTIHELAINPEIQERLYQECRQLKEDKGLTFDSLSDLKYLECVINETLRKWTPAIFMDRTCVKTYELPPPREGGESYTLKPGDIVYNMVNCIHMDPNHYPDPHKFDPERFSEENKHNITPYTFSPFGGGPRICIGMRFAMMEIKVLIFQILMTFSIVKTEKTMDPIKLKPHNFSIKALDGTWVKFQKRG
ncbi:hypothetical protein PYW08_016805 [Mythimna loreyi]|uniref:Uncharacterized protein n=1 Tax=Mythimna loreyi TaxID=667449 RepID=A0ACC2R064_9NEOP|nr:hypothetical protein PYW08_016805 [Mythimna loreyi]